MIFSMVGVPARKMFFYLFFSLSEKDISHKIKYEVVL
jgi:hypothetical protein